MPINPIKLYVSLLAWAMLLTVFLTPLKAAAQPTQQRCAKVAIVEEVLRENHGEYPVFRMKAGGTTWRFYVNLKEGTWTHTYFAKGAPDSEAIECIYTAGTGFSAEGFR